MAAAEQVFSVTELIGNMISFLPLREIPQAAFVSRQWRYAVQSPQTYRRVILMPVEGPEIGRKGYDPYADPIRPLPPPSEFDLNCRIVQRAFYEPTPYEQGTRFTLHQKLLTGKIHVGKERWGPFIRTTVILRHDTAHNVDWFGIGKHFAVMPPVCAVHLSLRFDPEVDVRAVCSVWNRDGVKIEDIQASIDKMKHSALRYDSAESEDEDDPDGEVVECHVDVLSAGHLWKNNYLPWLKDKRTRYTWLPGGTVPPRVHNIVWTGEAS